MNWMLIGHYHCTVKGVGSEPPPLFVSVKKYMFSIIVETGFACFAVAIFIKKIDSEISGWVKECLEIDCFVTVRYCIALLHELTDLKPVYIAEVDASIWILSGLLT